ncbi:MAG: NAD(P)-dependent oxidoreductase [Candidatus Omnitrophica bacterium]|nr:NAD(P)-dependent oxidoreductase [Candidatus Omnitrophota bacterium]
MVASHTGRVGFLGLGTMGSAMATNLAKAGFSLVVWNRTAAKVQPLLRLKAKAGKSPAHVAADAEIVITMVSRPQDVEEVVLGPDGALEGLRAGSVLIDMSTVLPSTSRKLAGAVTTKRAEFLDAPVVGSKGPATAGTLVILVGGLPQTLARCRPILQAMGKTIVHAGNVGTGSALKLVTNLMLSHLMAGFAEAVVLSKAAGLDPKRLLEVLEAGTFRSPWYQTKGVGLLKEDFTAHFALKHMRKDLELMTTLARETTAALPVTEAIRQLYADAESAGQGELDYSAIFKHLLAPRKDSPET